MPWTRKRQHSPDTRLNRPAVGLDRVRRSNETVGDFETVGLVDKPTHQAAGHCRGASRRRPTEVQDEPARPSQLGQRCVEGCDSLGLAETAVDPNVSVSRRQPPMIERLSLNRTRGEWGLLDSSTGPHAAP